MHRAWILALVVAACGAPPKPAIAPPPAAPPVDPLLAHVPYDTPYAVISLDPPVPGQPSRVRQSIEMYLAKQLERPAGEGGVTSRLGLAILDHVRGKPRETWLDSLGVSRTGRLVVYGLPLAPVLRLELADGARLAAVVGRGLGAPAGRAGRTTYWIVGPGAFQLVVAIAPREAVLALIPEDLLDAKLPLVLGTRRPARSLASAPRSTMRDLVTRHRISTRAFGYVDFQRLVDVVVTEPEALGATLRQLVAPELAGCEADLARLAAAFPRMLAGYRRNDARTFEMTMVVEVPRRVTAALAKMRTASPRLAATSRRPVLEIVAALDTEAFLAWLAGEAGALRDTPLTCEPLAPLQQVAESLVTTLGRGPSFLHAWRSFRSFALSIDDITGDPPRLTGGHLLVVGDTIAKETPRIPMLGALRPNGAPVMLPLLPIPGLGTLHAAWKGDRLAVTTGDRAPARAVELLAAAARPSPIFEATVDMVRLEALLARLGEDTDSMGLIDWMTMRLELHDHAIEMVTTGAWVRPDQPPIVSPPSTGNTIPVM